MFSQSARWRSSALIWAPLTAALALGCGDADSEPDNDELGVEVSQLTHGPQHHYYGYIGHVQNTPFSGDDRHLVVLRVDFQDRMPLATDVAEIVLLDAQNDFAEEVVEQTRAFNPQQGTMLYWNPEAPSTQFFFNDRDPATGKVFTVLYDIELHRRVWEYRFSDTPVGNSGVAQPGGAFAAINYARLSRLRPVTGYAGAWDWTEGVLAPDDDGVFVVSVATGEANLVASFARLRDLLESEHPSVTGAELFINHTLYSRDGSRLFFFVRGDFLNPETRIDVPLTMRPDGSGLTEQRTFIGGHPEWAEGSRMIGAVGSELVLYDTETQQVVEAIGTPEIFPDPEGDTALSPDGAFIVNGWSEGSETRYAIFRRSDGAFLHTPAFDRGPYIFGGYRIDAAPTWNRAGDTIVVPALAPDGTRQLFRMVIR